MESTELAGDARDNPEDAGLDALLPGAYDELRRIARHHLRRHAEVGILSTTAVVHEAYLKLAGGRARWEHRDHFLALASRAMRQLLVDHARRRLAEKRGGHGMHITLSQAVAQEAPVLDVIELDSALSALARVDPMLERVVECRFFAGLDVEETASALGRSPRSVERDWARARAYLFQWLSPR